MGQNNHDWLNFILFFSCMIHGDPTCWNEKDEHSEERKNGKKMMKKKEKP
jgi:hypothetical protein